MKDTETRRRGDTEARRQPDAERIRELEAEVDRLNGVVSDLANERASLQSHLDGAGSPARSSGCPVLEVAAVELPADYKGHLPRRIVVSLRPELRRQVMALYAHLTSTHATTQHPRYHQERVHVDSPAHVVVWLLEQVRLSGSR